MAEFSTLSREQLASFDKLIEQVQANPNFIEVIVVYVVWAYRIARIVDLPPEVMAGKLAEGPAARLRSGKVSAHDLIEIRKSFTSGK